MAANRNINKRKMIVNWNSFREKRLARQDQRRSQSRIDTLKKKKMGKKPNTCAYWFFCLPTSPTKLICALQINKDFSFSWAFLNAEAVMTTHSQAETGYRSCGIPKMCNWQRLVGDKERHTDITYMPIKYNNHHLSAGKLRWACDGTRCAGARDERKFDSIWKYKWNAVFMTHMDRIAWRWRSSLLMAGTNR